MRKPLGRKAYGSIPHLPQSRLGSGDHYISEGQAKIATEKPRDHHDTIIVQEKLDGSNVAIAHLQDGRIVPLVRSGYLAETSPYLQHHIFSDWVYANIDRFYAVLNPGEWISGEWLAQAHGTRYKLQHEPFVAFDLWVDGVRLPYSDFFDRILGQFETPRVLFSSGGMSIKKSYSIESALSDLEDRWEHGALDPIEGAVWRVERDNKVEFLCKFVRHDKTDGCYLPDISGAPIVWNENLELYLPAKALQRLKEFGQ